MRATKEREAMKIFIDYGDGNYYYHILRKPEDITRTKNNGGIITNVSWFRLLCYGVIHRLGRIEGRWLCKKDNEAFDKYHEKEI